ncbi:formate dehydrogenase [Pseudorhodoferax sp.]|uniref:formate dehydrogenase n=1 Tax=Pseudorhodoferax sp. TaxID=1993553 RepID=UPI002DD69DE3|nr:formate dehydrogenase [Pseudorhodoferax sp.]
MRQPALSRRTVFAGVGVAGAAATAAAVLPRVVQPPAAAAAAVPTPTGGYQLTEHVQRYYQTARV